MMRWLAVGSVLAALLAGCKPPDEAVVEQKPTNVEVQVGLPRPMVDRLVIRGIIEPWVSVRLSAETAGRLVYIGKAEGDAVTCGERLFGLDKAVLQANLAAAEARAEYAVVAHQRAKTMFADQAVSKDELDRTKAEMDAAVAAVELAKAQLANADVLSPIDGFFDAKLAEIGQYMTPGTPLGDVVDTRRVKIIVQVPEKDVSFVRVGQTIPLVVEALGDEPRLGKVIFIKQVADPQTLTFPVHLELANDDGRIRPGMIAKVQLVRREIPGAVAVNIFSVVRHDGGYRVFVEADGVARARDVTLGVFDGVFVQVLSGLQVGDRLIVKGQRELVDGAKVAVVETGGRGDGRLDAQAADRTQPEAVLNGAEAPAGACCQGSPSE